MRLNLLRENIDIIDQKLIKLLNDRMEQAVMSRKLKEKIEDSGREEAVLDRVKDSSTGLLNPDFTEKLYKLIIAESKRLQNEKKKIIGFQGEHGAYSEEAAKAWNNDIVTVPCVEFADVFEGLKQVFLITELYLLK